MTLPFRRRHHDAEASHDRARKLWTGAMLEPIEAEERAWLERHLEACRECRVEHAHHQADRELLRSLRTDAPQPPRDLWARTAAAIEQERARRRRLPVTLPGAGPGGPFRRVPVGATSGLLVVLVVVAATIMARQPVIPPPASPSSDVAVGSPEPAATPLLVTAADVRWLRQAVDGSYEVVVAGVDQVCPDERSGCPDLEMSVHAPIKLGGRPIGVTLSPARDEIVVISAAEDGVAAKIIVVTVPEATPAATPSAEPVTPPPTDEPASPAPPTPGQTATPTPPTTPTPVPSEPSSTPTGSGAEPTPAPTPEGTREIASGVVVVGDAMYSLDGRWLAFSAQPSDLSTGPDLYIWRSGSDAAVAVTSDHRTYFSSWLDGHILASRVELDQAPDPSAVPTPDTIDEPTPPSSAGPSDEPSAEPSLEARPLSFLLDPATLEMTDLAEPDVWLPVVDPTGRLVVYWSGTVAPTADGMDWQPASGQVVLDRWGGTDAGPVGSEAPSEVPSGAAATDGSSSEPGPSVGPAGAAVVLAEGPIGDFDARFDPDGRHLGLWTLDSEAQHGRLQLLVVDPETGIVDLDAEPLKGVPALRGFSIKEGRLAWVTPPGQDGLQSSVQVLAWKDLQFGHVKTGTAQELLVLD